MLLGHVQGRVLGLSEIELFQTLERNLLGFALARIEQSSPS